VKLVLHPLDLNFREKRFSALENKRAFLNPGQKSHRERGLGGRFAHHVYIPRFRSLALLLRTILIAVFKLVGPLMQLVTHILQRLGNPPVAGLCGQPKAFLAWARNWSERYLTPS
jgi:hypothetical protein